MVAALASRELGRAVNRKRAQRVMRHQGLLQRHRPPARRRRPRFFRVRRTRRALAPGHDQHLGRPVRLVLSQRDHRLLHPRDHRMEP